MIAVTMVFTKYKLGPKSIATHRFAEYYREIESRQVNVKEEILRFFSLCLSNSVR